MESVFSLFFLSLTDTEELPEPKKNFASPALSERERGERGNQLS